MRLLFFLLLLLSHLIGDFWLQTDPMVRRKRFVMRLSWSGLSKRRRAQSSVRSRVRSIPVKMSRALRAHLMHHAGVSWLFTAPYLIYHHQWLWLMVLPCLITGFHGVIDVWKLNVSRFFRKHGGPSDWFGRVGLRRQEPRRAWPSRSAQLILFAGDQGLHVLSLFLVTYACHPPAALAVWQGLLSLLRGEPLSLLVLDKIIAVLVLVIAATLVSGVVVQIFAKPEPVATTYLMDKKVTLTDMYESGLPARERKEETVYLTMPATQVKRGAMIGYFERLLILTAIVTGAYTAIAFIAAAKSLARFRKLDNPEWAEYFLVGTLASMFCGTICGFILKALLNLHG